jgi:hypothetical protein
LYYPGNEQCAFKKEYEGVTAGVDCSTDCHKRMASGSRSMRGLRRVSTARPIATSAWQVAAGSDVQTSEDYVPLAHLMDPPPTRASEWGIETGWYRPVLGRGGLSNLKLQHSNNRAVKAVLSPAKLKWVGQLDGSDGSGSHFLLPPWWAALFV